MYYRAVTIGENLSSLTSFKHFDSLYELDFDFLVGLGKEFPTILFIDGATYSEEIIEDWLFAFTNIILINNNPIRAFIVNGYKEEKSEFKGYYRIVGSYKSSRQIAEDIMENIETQLNKIVGSGEKMVELKKMIILSMFYEGSVMILGETGAGKNLLAEIMVKLSPRGTKPFYSMNCAAIPENLLESELFGYKKGAFTGANGEKTGLIEMADGGTLFLDEIGDMPLNLQAKILSVTESREFFKIGAVKPKKVNVRFITATNRFEDEALRRDLRFRLSSIKFELSPLRERKTDIPMIFDSILESKGYLVRFDNLQKDLKERFLSYDYPGNVRELINMIEEYLAINNVVCIENRGAIDSYVDAVSEEAIIAYITKGMKYKDFLSEFHKKVSKEILKDRLKNLDSDMNKIADEFGLTARRLRDLTNEFGLKK